MEEVSRACVAQLMQSERGQSALCALGALLWDHCTWSLDGRNQSALCELMQWSLSHPTVRELVQQAAHEVHARTSRDDKQRSLHL